MIANGSAIGNGNRPCDVMVTVTVSVMVMPGDGRVKSVTVTIVSRHATSIRQ